MKEPKVFYGETPEVKTLRSMWVKKSDYNKSVDLLRKEGIEVKTDKFQFHFGTFVLTAAACIVIGILIMVL
jgi:hypothetical protein